MMFSDSNHATSIRPESTSFGTFFAGGQDSNRGLTPPARSDLPTGLYDTDNTTASQTLNTTHTV